MELQIQDLISSIKKEGIEAAENQAEAIISEARVKAEDIISGARAQAADATEEAKGRIATLTEGARVNVEQAQRDAVLSFKKAIEAEYRKILISDIKKTVNGKVLAELIKAALNGEDASKYEAEVSEVTEELKAELAAEIKNGLEIKLSSGNHAGFRLSAKDGSGFFDCTDDEIAEMIMPFFSKLNI